MVGSAAGMGRVASASRAAVADAGATVAAAVVALLFLRP